MVGFDKASFRCVFKEDFFFSFLVIIIIIIGKKKKKEEASSAYSLLFEQFLLLQVSTITKNGSIIQKLEVKYELC